MREPGSPEYDPPAADQTLQQWLAGSSTEWMVSQPTLWLPAVPAESATIDQGRPAIPNQRGGTRRRPPTRAVNGSAATATNPGTARLDTDCVPGRLDRYPRSALVAALLGLGLDLTQSVGAAVLALPAGVLAIVIAADRLIRPGPGVGEGRALRLHRAFCLAAVLIGVVAVWLAGSALLDAITTTGAPG